MLSAALTTALLPCPPFVLFLLCVLSCLVCLSVFSVCIRQAVAIALGVSLFSLSQSDGPKDGEETHTNVRCQRGSGDRTMIITRRASRAHFGVEPTCLADREMYCPCTVGYPYSVPGTHDPTPINRWDCPPPPPDSCTASSLSPRTWCAIASPLSGRTASSRSTRSTSTR